MSSGVTIRHSGRYLKAMGRKGIKVGIIMFSGPLSGIGLYSYELARALAALDIGVYLIMNEHFQFAKVEGLVMAKLFKRTRSLPVDLLKVFCFLRRERIRLVHFQSFIKRPVFTFLMVKVLRLSGVTVVFTAHDIKPHYCRWYERAVLRKLYSNMSTVIVHSQDNRNALMDLAPDLRTQVRIIPHGIFDFYRRNRDMTNEIARKRMNIPTGAFVLLFFGRLDERKGAVTFVKEMPKIVEFQRDVFLVMAGRSKYPANYLQELSLELGIADSVLVVDRWIGNDEVEGFFVMSDAVVLPYLEGSTSGVLKVAMGFKKPVIATRAGELKEVVPENDAGILVDLPFSEKEVVKVCRFISQVRNREREFYRNIEFSVYRWEEIGKATNEVYESIIDL